MEMKDLAYEQRKTALIEEITVAFDGVSREGGVTLHEAMVVEVHGSEEERAFARTYDSEARWQDVPDEYIELGHDLLHFLDAVGFHYYLPAYLVWYVRNLGDEDPDLRSHTFDSVEFHLLVGRGASNDHRQAIAAFTRPQSRAVAKFLVLLAEGEDSAAARTEVAMGATLPEGGLPLQATVAEGDTDALILATRGFGVKQAAQALEKYWGQFLVDEAE